MGKIIEEKNLSTETASKRTKSSHICVKQGNAKTPLNGHWNVEEQAKYLKFLRNKYYVMKNSQLRYHYRIFNQMSQYIKTRTSMQCKSHHQKVLKKHHHRLEEYVFHSGDLYSYVEIGKDQQNISQIEAVQAGIKDAKLDQNNPFILVDVDDTILIIVDQKYMESY